MSKFVNCEGMEVTFEYVQGILTVDTETTSYIQNKKSFMVTSKDNPKVIRSLLNYCFDSVYTVTGSSLNVHFCVEVSKVVKGEKVPCTFYRLINVSGVENIGSKCIEKSYWDANRGEYVNPQQRVYFDFAKVLFDCIMTDIERNSRELV